MIRVIVVDDEPMVCAHLRTILGTADDIEVVATAHDGEDGLRAALRHRPDIVLMDLRMPGMDGLTAIQRLRDLPQSPVVVALTTFDADRYVISALNAGAAGYLVKSTPPHDLIGLVRVAAGGHTVLSPVATGRLLAARAQDQTIRDEAEAAIQDLTSRETSILACLGTGLTNAQIASTLHLSEATVRSYVSRMLTKLGCANRTQAGLLAQQAGLPARTTPGIQGSS